MGKNKLAKVMKYTLQYLDGCGSFYDMQNAVWTLQKQSREILNKTIQEALHWDYISRKHFVETGEYLDVEKETGYKRLDGYIYDHLKRQYPDMASNNLNATLQKAWKKYNNVKLEVLKGNISLPSYRSNQPILLDKRCVKISESNDGPVVTFTLFSNNYKKSHEIASNVRFLLKINDGTQMSIYKNLVSEVYALGQCQLVYEKKKWFLLITYIFTPTEHGLDPEKILGVDLGETYAVYASSTQGYGAFKIEGGEVTAYAKELEARKRSLLKQATYCGKGRIGHGTKTRVADIYKTRDRIANYRDTINHRYSKALVDYAVKNGYGTIQMEDLSGIKATAGFPKRLQHWTYYDLQSKIESKAKEYGIVVRKINPRYTSQRCSKCGHIDSQNRTSQADFHCTACGFSCNADYNASQNISIKGIDGIISSANMKQTE